MPLTPTIILILLTIDKSELSETASVPDGNVDHSLAWGFPNLDGSHTLAIRMMIMTMVMTDDGGDDDDADYEKEKPVQWRKSFLQSLLASPPLRLQQRCMGTLPKIIGDHNNVGDGDGD